tara:strand:+ start:9070 stop:10908 length:1839 start_codon:yes stop_codon:yes gene_type:complete
MIKNDSLLVKRFLKLSIFYFIFHNLLNIYSLENKPNNQNTLQKNNYDKKIYFEKVIDKKNKSFKKIKWEKLENKDLLDFEFNNINKEINPFPQSSDYLKSDDLSPLFITSDFLLENDFYIKILNISSFDGGYAGGSGIQNYGFKIDYGLSDFSEISFFYSVADDPLSTKLNKFDFILPNYWESYGFAFKKLILGNQKNSISVNTSIESWFVRSGNDNVPNNMFNNENIQIRNKNIIGSFSLPVKISMKNINYNLISGISFLPSKQVDNKNNFYGNNLFFGAGFDWIIDKKTNFRSSYVLPLGPGNNSFDQDIIFKKNPIYSFSLEWSQNPKFEYILGITNGFGLTPATGILTIPANNKPLYSASFRYFPSGLDNPYFKVDKLGESLTFGGLIVNNGLIPKNRTLLFSNSLQNNGNYLSTIKYSFSNDFQLNLLSFGNSKGIDLKDNQIKNNIINTYLNDNNIFYRVGGKLNIFNQSRGDYIFSTLNISMGRELNNSNSQGYGFLELANTRLFGNKIATNLSPKFTWNNVAISSSLGISSNFALSNSIEFIPEFNLSTSSNSENNYAFVLRKKISKTKTIDLFITNAAGLSEIGQMFKSNQNSYGLKFTIKLD